VSLLPSVVYADVEVEKQSFETIDKVSIQCDWYPSSKATKAPTVMLLHKIGGNRKQMASIAEKLQEAGFAVLSFDFRGHGDSNKVDDKAFWKVQANMRGIRTVAGARRDVIDYKNFTPAYYPQLVQDIAAAKFYLEQKNNARECNVNDLVLVGAEDGATLGAVWLYS